MVKITLTAKKTLKEQMKGKTWSSFWRESVNYAEKRLGQEVWFGVRGGVPPGCKMGVDIVDLVIQKVLSGRLKCKPDVDFKAFFFRTIRAEVSLLAKSKKNLKVISEHHYSQKRKEYFSQIDKAASDAVEHNGFYSKYSEEFIEAILTNFLNYVQKDELLGKITKIFVYSGVIFSDCFEGMIQDEKVLVLHLLKQGYINVEGEVQYKFWKLTNASELKLPIQFNRHKKIIFLIINQSLNIEKPREIASWLNLDVGVVYAKRQKMERYIRRFRDVLYKGEYDG